MNVLWLAQLVSCSCDGIPNTTTSETTSSSSTAATGSTAHTAVAEDCATPEAEPNDIPEEASALPMEEWACGTVQEPLDYDVWAFTHAEDGWLKIEVDAANGSSADMSFLLTPTFEGWAAFRPDDAESMDSTLIFSAPAGDYRLLLQEETSNGGDRYGYDLLVSEAKPPAKWTSVEAEPNDTAAFANPITSGAAVFGTFSGNGAIEDHDYYAVAVPAGRHSVAIDVDAFDVYSNADPMVVFRNDALEDVLTIKGGSTGDELDPVGAYESEGSEILYIQVIEQLGSESPAHWYVLQLTVEAV